MSGFDSLSITSQERKYLTLKFPKEFEAFKEANKDKYAIVDEITVKQGDNLEFIGLNNRKKSQDYEKLLVGSFLDLLNKDEEFANKLIKYSYLTSGFNNHTTQFFTMIPTQWFNRNNINRYILDKSAEYNTSYTDSNDDNFIDQYYLANLENKKLVKNVSAKQMLKGSWSIHGFTLDKPGKAGYFRVNSDPMGQRPDVYYKLIGYDVEYRGVYSRFIPNINDELSEIKMLNVKDKKSNRIINYDTKGINLKPVTETSPGLANQINKKVLSKLHDSAIYRRDIFYRENVIIKKESEIKIKQQEVTSKVSEMIYNELGNKTKSKNVEIVKWGYLKEYTEPIKTNLEGEVESIVATRIHNKVNHFGNPFSHDPAGKTKGLIKTETIKEAVENYIDWVINSNEDRAQWIREQLKSGNLKNKPILYYTELKEPSHATALDYLINEYNNEVREVKPQQLSLFDNLQESKTMLNLKEMFNNGLMLNKFNKSGINNVDDLNKLSEDELGELLKKICK